MYLVTSTDVNFTTIVLSVNESHEKAISYLTSHIDYQYEPQKNNYRISQRNKDTFDVCKIGYLYKSFICKLQIIRICDKKVEEKKDN